MSPRADIAVNRAALGTPYTLNNTMAVNVKLSKYAAHLANANAPVCQG